MAGPERAGRRRAVSHLIHGVHAARLCLLHRPEAVLELWVGTGVRSGGAAALLEAARHTGVVLHRVGGDTLEGLAGTASHQGVVMRCRPPPVLDRAALLQAASKPGTWFLALDRVQDARNLGACLRAVDAVGAGGLLLGAHGTAPLNAAAVKTACGAAETVPIYRVSNLAGALRELRRAGSWVFGADPGAADSFYQARWPDCGGLVLVLGGEGGGLRPAMRACCDALLCVPMAGQVESLNLGVASAVILFELRRRGAGAHPIPPTDGPAA